MFSLNLLTSSFAANIIPHIDSLYVVVLRAEDCL